MNANKRVKIAGDVINRLLRETYSDDRASALIVLTVLAERYQRALSRDADTRRRIAALMRASAWIESKRDYKRITRVVDHVAVLDEAELTPEEHEKLDALSALIVAHDTGACSKT